MSVFRRLLGLFMLAVLISLPITHAKAYTWRVPSEHPSICGSVDSAAYGDTVLVAPGTYEREIPDPFEYWIVMKDGITLKSESGPEGTVLVAATHETARSICCESIVDARIIGFTISNEYGHCGGCAGIEVNASQVDIIRNVIDNFYYGIVVSGEAPAAEMPVIRWNTIVGGHYGIRVHRVSPAGSPRIQGNRIVYCFEEGILIHDSSPIVMANTLEHNSTAVFFMGASETDLTRNKINDNGTAVSIWSDGATQLPSLNAYGNMQEANDICRNACCVCMFDGPGTILARYNYWGSLCPDSADFSGNVDFSPWVADSAHTSICNNCETCMTPTRPTTWSSIKAMFQ